MNFLNHKNKKLYTYELCKDPKKPWEATVASLDLNTLQWTSESYDSFHNQKYFYTLCYSEFLSDSYLKLYRFSIKDGSHQILGDSIPIHSDKITANANLYYARQLQKIIVTVQESSLRFP